MQLLFDVAHRYSSRWRFQFNPQKCSVLVFGTVAQPNIQLGPNQIKVTKCENHLGVPLTMDAKHELDYIKDRVGSCKSVCYGIQSLGSQNVPMSPVVATKLYRDVCLSKLCYGVEIMDVFPESRDEMERFQSSAAKTFQGLPNQTANIGSMQTLGWQSIQAVIDLTRLMFLWRILLLPMSNIYKCVMLHKILNMVESQKGLGPTWNMIVTCEKYELLETVISAICNGTYMTIKEWKQHVTKCIDEKDTKQQKITAIMYSSLQYLEQDRSDLLGWLGYQHKFPEQAKKCRCILRLLLNVNRLGKEICSLCDMFQKNSIEHILFECISGREVRERCWGEVVMELNRMDVEKKCKFILNGFMCKYTDEWHLLYHSVAKFIYITYSHYNALLV